MERRAERAVLIYAYGELSLYTALRCILLILHCSSSSPGDIEYTVYTGVFILLWIILQIRSLLYRAAPSRYHSLSSFEIQYFDMCVFESDGDI